MGKKGGHNRRKKEEADGETPRPELEGTSSALPNTPAVNVIGICRCFALNLQKLLDAISARIDQLAVSGPTRRHEADDDCQITKLRDDMMGVRLNNKSDTEIQEMHMKLYGKGRKAYQAMPRPDRGKLGRKTDLITNFFEVIALFEYLMCLAQHQTDDRSLV